MIRRLYFTIINQFRLISICGRLYIFRKGKQSTVGHRSIQLFVVNLGKFRLVAGNLENDRL